MRLEFDDDQRALLDAVGAVAAVHRALPLAGGVRFEYSTALARDLEAGGYFDAVLTDGLGPPAAAAMLIELAQLPACAEIAASALLAPRLGLPRPCAVLEADRGAPARFLPQARSVVAIGPDGVFHAALRDGDARHVDSLFAYPMGVLAAPEALAWQPAAIGRDEALDLWRSALAAETVGCLAAALDSVLAHVKDRRQFGRPLGSLQAVQHRLAGCATRIEGARWLALAAAAGQVAPALAAAQAQQAVRPVCYDLHQFMGAMGLTLEHPLHRWTYRAKRLQAELGGAERQFAAAAAAAWPDPAPEGAR
ncbi:MAG: acyl-CoA dehydrogenase [Proteobacteria bacterium]|nr:acyl-CoA dehydrogenase [Pseudomonadota bacterium]